MARSVGMRLLKGPGSSTHNVDTEWLARHLRFNFYLNRLAAGDRLPSVRELGRTLHISPNTALELYKGLENAGLVETRPRSGTFLRRIGHEADRTVRDLTVFAMMVRLTRRLDLMGVPPSEFADLLLRYSGATRRQSFTFAFISSAERFQILERQLVGRLKWRLPITVLAPDVKSVRKRLAQDPTIRCFLCSYIYCDLAFSLADEFNLQVIIERLDPVTAGIFEPPATGKRYIVTRDEEFADGIRQLVQAGYGNELASRMVVAGLDEPGRLSELDQADELLASPLALEAAVARYGSTKRVLPLRVEISTETVEDLLFHYAFLPRQDPGTRSEPLAPYDGSAAARLPRGPRGS